MQSHDDIDRRGLTMAREIVARIDADPTHAGLAQARNVCERWVSQGVGPAAQEWQGILLRSWDDVRRILLDESENGFRLRQNSPFCGILSPRERWTFFRKEGNRETART